MDWEDGFELHQHGPFRLLNPLILSCYFQSVNEIGFYVRFGVGGLLMVGLGEFSRGFSCVG